MVYRISANYSDYTEGKEQSFITFVKSRLNISQSIHIFIGRK